MSRFIESIRLENGAFGNLDYHQSRVDFALRKFYPAHELLNLKSILSSIPMPSIGLHKVRLVYDHEIQSVQISYYSPREIKSLRLIQADSISYHHKFEDRNELQELYELRNTCDEIIIVKENKITDASFANLVFKKDNQWLTPSSYLLNGTMRQQLLFQKIIFERDIYVNDLPHFEKVKLINSMLQFDAPEIDVSAIVQ
ncbi:MAG TPA: chorismate-binding protein [Cytophagales bacterium]|jgi:4-amino-4-deoxychorismate lyase|nr:chorismate-binding protein [Cytophagales bacterium]